MAEERNALAELAERLKGTDKPSNRVSEWERVGMKAFSHNDIDKAQRIVAELAKPDRIDGRIACEIMMKCRAIAEEGAGDGK